MRVRELLLQARESLAPLVQGRALFEARLLLSKATGRSEIDLISHDERVIEAEREAEFWSLVKRRLAHEPMAYLLGSKEFFGFSFLVDSHVLIPRPETEDLVTWALEWIPADAEKSFRVADLGTGSGCIAISVALNRPHISISAFEFSSEAIDVAKKNAQSLGAQNVEFILCDFVKDEISDGFDLILSNPPYIPWKDQKALAKDIQDYEPESALFAGADGLHYFKVMAEKIWPLVRSGGALIVETYDQSQRDRIRAWFQADLQRVEEKGCHIAFFKA